MPNYVRNHISFEGPEEAIRKMLEEIQVDKLGPGSIDFNKIIPMPESLSIEAGSRTDEGLRMYRSFISAQALNQDISRYLRYQKENKEKWDLGKQAYENIQQYNAPTWYEWCTKNWGTKWPAIHDDISLSNDSLRFDTAWAFPLSIVEKLSQMYPTITIKAEWADEDIGNNCGRTEFRAGKLEDFYIPTDQREAVTFAESVWETAMEDFADAATVPVKMSEVANSGMQVTPKTREAR